MSTIIWLMIIVPGALALLGAWRTKHSKRPGAARPPEVAAQRVQPPPGER